MAGIIETIKNFIGSMGFNYIFGEKSFVDGKWMGWQYLVMYVIAGVLIYLAIAKKFEPLLLLPIAIGMLLTNLPGANLFHLDMWIDDAGKLTVLESIKMVLNKGGFLDLLYIGVKLGIYNNFWKKLFLGVENGWGICYNIIVNKIIRGFYEKDRI